MAAGQGDASYVSLATRRILNQLLTDALDQKPILDQIKLVTEKWDPSNPSCVFKHYFYNKVDEAHIPFYKPQPHEDPREWEEALQNKPAPGFMPVLCSGYTGVADRLKTQKRAISEFNTRLHQINSSLDAILQRHELETEVRALAARRRQTAISERCLALAARVQILRNRGYALSGDEDDLKNRLQNLCREVQDPALGAREEELWSRLIVLRAYSDRLNKELDKPAVNGSEELDPDMVAKAKRVSFYFRITMMLQKTNKTRRYWRTMRSSFSTSKRNWRRWGWTLMSGRRAVAPPRKLDNTNASDGRAGRYVQAQLCGLPRCFCFCTGEMG